MGTRNLTCVIKDGKYRVAQYGQWDGYPGGQGINILNFLKKMDRSLFEKKLDMVSWATEDELNQMWAEAGADLESPFVSMDIAEKHKKLYPENSRDIGSDVLKIIQNTERPLKLKNSIDFAKDSLFCEWAYIINLGIYSKKPPHFNEEMNCYLALYVQDVPLYFIDLTYLL